MNILITVNTYYPLKDGISIVTQYLAEGLAKKGHSITVVTMLRDEDEIQNVRNGVVIKRLKISENYFKQPSGEIDKFYDELLSDRYDIVINEYIDSVLTNLAFAVLDRIKGKKILHLHGMAGLRRKLFTPQNGFVHYVGNVYHYFRGKKYYAEAPNYIKKYNAVLCLSKYDESYNYLIENGLNNVFVLGNACDDMFFSNNENVDALNRYNIPERYLLSVANYNPRKNQMGILKAFMKIHNPDYALVFIGSCRNRYYEKLIKHYDRNKDFCHTVLFLINVDRNDIPEITKHAMLTLQLSSWEGYSISLIESMASGIPFISNDTGNAKELPGGIIVKDYNDMAIQIDDLIKNNDKYQSLSAQAKHYASNHCTREKRVQELQDIIDIC